jgi:hypothetical protein
LRSPTPGHRMAGTDDTAGLANPLGTAHHRATRGAMSAALQAQPIQDPPHVHPHPAGGHPQPRGNRGVRPAGHDESAHLPLEWRRPWHLRRSLKDHTVHRTPPTGDSLRPFAGVGPSVVPYRRRTTTATTHPSRSWVRISCHARRSTEIGSQVHRHAARRHDDVGRGHRRDGVGGAAVALTSPAATWTGAAADAPSRGRASGGYGYRRRTGQQP